ncbi:MAG: hypothetical protein M3N68_01205 [Actinomycetota bacterium]|nr:hypothetical protein [Actinomycetota bacterium]
MRFQDRHDACGRLAEGMIDGFVDPVVLAVPRGGVPVAFEAARALHAPLEVFVARNIGVPGHREVGTGVTAEAPLRPLQNQAPRHLLASASPNVEAG